jgi:hypothetical protein
MAEMWADRMTIPMNIPEVDAAGFVRRDGLLSVPDTPGFGWKIDPDRCTWLEPVGVWT